MRARRDVANDHSERSRGTLEAWVMASTDCGEIGKIVRATTLGDRNDVMHVESGRALTPEEVAHRTAMTISLQRLTSSSCPLPTSVELLPRRDLLPMQFARFRGCTAPARGFGATGTAEPRAAVPVGVRRSELVASITRRLGSVLSRRGPTAQDVLGLGDGLEVLGVDAGRLRAEMVDDSAVRDLADEQRVGSAMCRHVRAVQPEGSVAPVVDRGRPDPAGTPEAVLFLNRLANQPLTRIRRREPT